MGALKLGCLVMAAGNARRFGGNKLTADFGGRPVIELALEAVPGELFHRVTVVTQYDEVAEAAARFGFDVIRNLRPDLGISHTIHLGTKAMADCDGILYQVSDQPCLSRASLEKELALFRANPDKIIALSHGGVRGNPCLFPARFFPELMALTGDKGGGAVIRRHEEALLLCEVSGAELVDVDTPQALEELKIHRN